MPYKGEGQAKKEAKHCRESGYLGSPSRKRLVRQRGRRNELDDHRCALAINGAFLVECKKGEGLQKLVDIFVDDAVNSLFFELIDLFYVFFYL